MYIKRIILENFQAFEKAEFNLSPNLNVLVGVSNVGKSSVARALSLILFNKWDKSWVKFGAKHCRVTIMTDTGISVIREKGEKVNKYILFFDGASATTYEAFGTTVPEPIQQALKIHEVQIDTTDTLNLNLANQMDSLFLLSQTGSYRAKVLGKLSGATYLDHAIRELNGDKRKITAEKNSKDLEIIDLQAQVDKLAGVEAYAPVITELEARLTSLTAAEQRVERIRNLFQRAKVTKDAWNKAMAISDLLGPVSLSLAAVDSLSVKVDKNKAVSLLYSKVANLKLALARESKLRELLTPVDLSAFLGLAEKVAVFKIKSDCGMKILKNRNELVSRTNELAQVEQKHQATAKEYGDMLKDNGVCPTCNQPTANVCVQ